MLLDLSMNTFTPLWTAGKTEEKTLLGSSTVAKENQWSSPAGREVEIVSSLTGLIYFYCFSSSCSRKRDKPWLQ